MKIDLRSDFEKVYMGVEELSGSYGWPHFENREAEGSVHA